MRGSLCRGSGEVLGKKQSGVKTIGCFRATSLPQDQDLLEFARADATSLQTEHGIKPENWPSELLAALGDREMPALDIAQLPTHSLASHDPSFRDPGTL